MPRSHPSAGSLGGRMGSCSVEDASAELCSVMAAVGSGATFRFETTPQNQHVMVFVFPPDFRQRALAAKRREDWKERAVALGRFLLKVTQIVTAFGLILSLLILSIAALLAMVAALIALSRDRGGGNQRLSRQIRHLCLTIREVMWCYALFGPDLNTSDDPQQDGVLREMAYDVGLVLSVCCGHPGSVFYWWRVQQLSRRRHRMARGWRRRHNYETMDSPDVDGVRLIRPSRRWSDDNNNDTTNNTLEDVPLSGAGDAPSSSRGILSVAVEFLFGPSNNTAKSLNSAKWKLQAAFLVRSSSMDENAGGGVSLAQMSPYTDQPPSSLQDSNQLVSQGLEIVSHFHGAPLQLDSDKQQSSLDKDMTQARFVFPELMSESAVALRYDASSAPPLGDSQGSWASILYQTESPPSSRNHTTSEFPTYFHEPHTQFTNLTPTQFKTCAILGVLNWLGVLWFRQATSLGGVMLEVAEFHTLARVLRATLVPVLVFYANLFWALVGVRLLWVIVCNRRRRERNRTRQVLAQQLEEPRP